MKLIHRKLCSEWHISLVRTSAFLKSNGLLKVRREVFRDLAEFDLPVTLHISVIRLGKGRLPSVVTTNSPATLTEKDVTDS